MRTLAKADAMTSLSLRWSPRRSWRAPLASWSLVLACLVAFVGDVAPAAEPTAGAVLPPPAAITLEAAVALTLQQNPDLAAIRQQHGIAAGGVVIAHTYPF